MLSFSSDTVVARVVLIVSFLLCLLAIADENSLQTVAEEDSSQTVGEEDNSQTVGEEDSSQTVAEKDCPQTVAEEDSPQTVAEEDSPQTVAEEDSPQTVAEEDSPQTVAEEDSPQTVAEEDSPQTVAEEDSPQTVAEEDSPQTVAEEDSPQTVAEEDSPQTVAEEDSPQTVAEEDSILIGVFSPLTGGLSEIGAAQKYLVKKGFQEAGNRIELKGRSIRIDLKNIDTKSHGACCEIILKTFLKDNPKAVAIIGPVSSDCVKSMMEINPRIPIISPMASATNLTRKNNNNWFFRANITDEARLQKLLEYVDQSKEFKENTSLVVYDDESEYGKGLMKDFSNIRVVKPEIKTVEQVVVDKSKLKNLLSNKNLFLLGNAEKTLEIAKLIRKEDSNKEFGTLNIFSVGSTPRLFEFQSERLITIGEVGFSKSDSVLVQQELDRIEQSANIAGHTFYPTIYAATRHIVYDALEKAMDLQGDAKLDHEKIRNTIQKLLETESFPSPSPPFHLRFDPKHDLVAEFDYPIYQLGWSLKRQNVASDNSRWVEVTSHDESVTFLESPVKVTVVGHNLSGCETTVTLKALKGILARNETMSFRQCVYEIGGENELEFHVLPGIYTVISNLPVYPNDVSINVHPFSKIYIILIFMAILGVIIRMKPEKFFSRRLVVHYLEGIVVAFFLVITITYLQRKYIPEFLTDAYFLNVAFIGFLSGYLCPQILEYVVNKIKRNTPPATDPSST